VEKKLAKGSKITYNENAYMTDETWIDIATTLAEGIRAMPIVVDHPDWWFVMFLDGYVSHLNPQALEIYANHKILCVKEEGDASDTNQSYDRHVAKADKNIIRKSLGSARTTISQNISIRTFSSV